MRILMIIFAFNLLLLSTFFQGGEAATMQLAVNIEEHAYYIHPIEDTTPIRMISGLPFDPYSTPIPIGWSGDSIIYGLFGHIMALVPDSGLYRYHLDTGLVTRLPGGSFHFNAILSSDSSTILAASYDGTDRIELIDVEQASLQPITIAEDYGFAQLLEGLPGNYFLAFIRDSSRSGTFALIDPYGELMDIGSRSNYELDYDTAGTTVYIRTIPDTFADQSTIYQLDTITGHMNTIEFSEQRVTILHEVDDYLLLNAHRDGIYWRSPSGEMLLAADVHTYVAPQTSPDGQHIAFVDQEGMLYLIPLHPDSVAIPLAEAVDRTPVHWVDNENLAFDYRHPNGSVRASILNLNAQSITPARARLLEIYPQPENRLFEDDLPLTIGSSGLMDYVAVESSTGLAVTLQDGRRVLVTDDDEISIQQPDGSITRRFKVNEHGNELLTLLPSEHRIVYRYGEYHNTCYAMTFEGKGHTKVSCDIAGIVSEPLFYDVPTTGALSVGGLMMMLAAVCLPALRKKP